MAIKHEKGRARRNGYSLTELMIVVAIVGIIGTTAARAFTQLINFYTTTRARIEIQRDLRTALAGINRSIRQAKADSVNISQETGSPPYSRIHFVDIDGAAHTYRQNGRSLYHDRNNVTRLLSDDLEYLAFAYPQTDVNSVISVSITLKKATVKGRTTALQMAVSKVRIMN